MSLDTVLSAIDAELSRRKEARALLSGNGVVARTVNPTRHQQRP